MSVQSAQAKADGRSESDGSTAAENEVRIVDDATNADTEKTDGSAAVQAKEAAQPPDPPHWRTNIALLVTAWTLGYMVQCECKPLCK